MYNLRVILWETKHAEDKYHWWGHLKQKVYKNNTPFANLGEREQQIVRCAREIPANVLHATVDKF